MSGLKQNKPEEMRITTISVEEVEHDVETDIDRRNEMISNLEGLHGAVRREISRQGASMSVADDGLIFLMWLDMQMGKLILKEKERDYEMSLVAAEWQRREFEKTYPKIDGGSPAQPEKAGVKEQKPEERKQKERKPKERKPEEPKPEKMKNAEVPQEEGNTGCEFYDYGRCKIGMEMMFCGKKCAYATNVPGTLPPYGTKYMRSGRL